MKTTLSKWLKRGTSTAVAVACSALLSGCAGSLGRISAEDPTERGCSYIAAAIVTAAVLRAFFNK